MCKSHVAQLDFWAEVHDVKNLVCKFAWVDVIAMRMIGDERYVEGTDMRDVRQALEEVVLGTCQLLYSALVLYRSLTQSL